MFSADSRHLGYLALKGPKLQVLVDVKVLQKIEILNQENKMLKEFLRQAEKHDMTPLKEGNRELDSPQSHGAPDGERFHTRRPDGIRCPFSLCLPMSWQGERIFSQGLTIRPKKVLDIIYLQLKKK